MPRVQEAGQCEWTAHSEICALPRCDPNAQSASTASTRTNSKLARTSAKLPAVLPQTVCICDGRRSASWKLSLHAEVKHQQTPHGAVETCMFHQSSSTLVTSPHAPRPHVPSREAWYNGIEAGLPSEMDPLVLEFLSPEAPTSERNTSMSLSVCFVFSSVFHQWRN